MAELSDDTVDLKNYMENAQPYISMAIKDPGSVPSRFMEDVASTIVNRAWEDADYYSKAALICHHIVEKEHENQAESAIPKYTFRTGLVNSCRLLMNDWEKMRQAKLEYWLSFCRFVAEVYKLIRPQGQVLKALSVIVIEVLTLLAGPMCINNFEEADLLCTLFHDCGRDLNKDNGPALDDVINSIRDAFLDAKTDTTTQSLLLPLIELHASNFDLSDNAKKFYFQM